MIPKTVTTQEFADFKSITLRRVNQLVEEGVLKRTSGGRLLFLESDQAYTQFKIEQYKTTDEKKRLERLKGDKIERELEILSGQYIEVSEAMTGWGKIVMSVRNRLLAIPKKAAPLMVGIKKMTEAEDILKRTVYEALRDLANPDLVKISLGVQKKKTKRRGSRKRK